MKSVPIKASATNELKDLTAERLGLSPNQEMNVDSWETLVRGLIKEDQIRLLAITIHATIMFYGRKRFHWGFGTGFLIGAGGVCLGRLLGKLAHG